MRRIRFKVPEAELLHARTFLMDQNFSNRTWVEILLTYLCCPSQTHPAVAHAGVTFEQLRKASILPGKVDMNSTLFDFRWPESLILTVDPGCKLAELSFQSLLSILWAWTHAPDLRINVNLATRLAAFATSIHAPRTWAEIRAGYKSTEVNANPHELIPPGDFDVRLLPWIVRVKGVTL